MKIENVQTYLGDLTGSDFGPDATMGESTRAVLGARPQGLRERSK